MRTLIENGTVIDPQQSLNDARNIYIEGNKIVAVLPPNELSQAPFKRDETDHVYNAQDQMICPGLVDIHVHLREPGHEYKETIESGCKAAKRGGFTDVCCMPNTKPVNDQPEITTFIIEKSRSFKGTRVHPVAAISPDSKGKGLTEMGLLLEAGACAFTDDGHPVSNPQLMRRAMEYALSFDALIVSHCEDLRLADGVMNEGVISTRMGLAGIPNAAESVMVMRDIALCELTGARLHIAHVSTAQSVEAIKIAKDKGLPVTAETAPHYFTLTDSAVLEYDTHAKMNPPLRTETDRAAIRQALADGVIDAIATDHAPHSDLEKMVPFDQAANGIIGLETSLPLGLRLVHDNVLTLSQLIEAMSIKPATIMKLPEKSIASGFPADLTIIDMSVKHTLSAKQFQSKSRNTPFEGWTVQGKVMQTIVDGRLCL
jgi:dihydroorotase